MTPGEKPCRDKGVPGLGGTRDAGTDMALGLLGDANTDMALGLLGLLGYADTREEVLH